MIMRMNTRRMGVFRRSYRQQPVVLPLLSPPQVAVGARRPTFMSTTTSTTTTTNPSIAAARTTTTDASSTTTASTSSQCTTSRTMMQSSLVAFISLSIGFAAGQTYTGNNNNHSHHHSHDHVLPNGLPRTCCEQQEEEKNNPKDVNTLTQEQQDMLKELRRICGKENVINGQSYNTQTLPFLKGARLGQGHAVAIVTPRRLHEVVDSIQAIVNADCVVLPQGQNTGLTGGSVPRQALVNSQERRPVVILSLKYLDRIFPLDDGKRVVCLAGVGLASLQQFLQQHFPHRESHSVLGSTFLNPTTAAGVAFGSGGTQVRKGPAYTERALYVKVGTNKWKEKVLQVVNTLDIEGMRDEDTAGIPKERARKMDGIPYRVDTWSRWVHEGYQREMRYSVVDDSTLEPPRAASDVDYGKRLCQKVSDPNKNSNENISRFNADTRGPDLNRSEGKVVILATVHDTFPKPTQTQTFWLSFDSLETALAFRQAVCLQDAADLPTSVEYMDADAYTITDRAGRLLGAIIQMTGTSSSLVRTLWNLKLWVEALPFTWAPEIVDRILYATNPMIPSILPRRIRKTAQEMDHHIAMTVGEYGDGNMERLLDRMKAFQTQIEQDPNKKMVVHTCETSSEAHALSAFRFVAAPAFRTWCVGTGTQGVSVDYALPKHDGRVPPLAVSTATHSNTEEVIVPVKRMRYSHFGCNVVHEDIAYAPGVDVHKAKHDLKHAVELESKGRLPAEHGHGTEYVAPPATQQRWKRMDPLNVLNPGVGGLSYNFAYQEDKK